jgi:folate-binding protein YgfZ
MTSPLPSLQGDAPWCQELTGPARIEKRVSLLHLVGPDTLRFLHGQTSQALEQARPGQWLGTCCLTPTGRARAVAEVLVDEGGAWLVITAGDGGAVREALDRVLFPADDVRLGELEEGVLIQPVGPRSAFPGTGTFPCSPPGTWVLLEEGEGWLLGEQVLLQAGRERPAWLMAWPAQEPVEAETLRIRQGLPAVPGEINGDTNPFELGLAPRVSLSKGCYAGQETLARLATYDGVKQQLRRWHCPDAGAVLAPGARLLDAAGERAGIITTALRLTAAPGNQVGGWIGLALIRRQALEADQLVVELPGGGEDTLAVLSISIPEAFVAPPVGAGGAASASPTAAS